MISFKMIKCDQIIDNLIVTNLQNNFFGFLNFQKETNISSAPVKGVMLSIVNEVIQRNLAKIN